MVLPSKKYIIDYNENSYRWVELSLINWNAYCLFTHRAHMKLTIKNLSVGDFGNYRCISKNSLGETEGSIRVYGESFYCVDCTRIMNAIFTEIPLPATPSKQVIVAEPKESKFIHSFMLRVQSSTINSTFSTRPTWKHHHRRTDEIHILLFHKKAFSSLCMDVTH